MSTSPLRSAYSIAAAMALLAALVVASPARAQQTSPQQTTVTGTFSFAVIDVQKIMREASATRAIRPQIDKLRNNFQAQFKKEEDSLRNADQDLQRQRAILSPEAFDERRKEFQQRASELQRKVQEARGRLDEGLGNAMSVVEKALREVVTQVAQERKVQLILSRSSVMLVENRFEITDEVLKRLNQKLPSVAVKLPARAAEPKKQ